MRDLHATFIRATKKIINQRLRRTNSPDARRPPHTIESPFNIPHPHRQDKVPALYILVKTTSQGVLKKVSLPIRDENQSIISPGDSSGYLTCSCKNPNDPSEQHNFARLITADPSTTPTLFPDEHFVTSPLVFPNILIQEPIENSGTLILVKLPENIKTLDQTTREQVLETVHQVLNEVGTTDVADHIYSERFTAKALGIEPSAPPATPPHIPTPDPESQEHITPFRAQLATQWAKGYKNDRKHGISSRSRTPSESELEDKTNDGYEKPSYLQLTPTPIVMMWATHQNIAPAIDLAFQKWNSEIDVPTELIRRYDKAIVIIAEATKARMMAVPTEQDRSTAVAELKQYYKTTDEAGKVRVGTLEPAALDKIHIEHIATIPREAYNVALKAIQENRSNNTPTPTKASSKYYDNSSTTETSLDWDDFASSSKPPKRKKDNRHTSRPHHYKGPARRNTSNTETTSNSTATCPLCKAIFADAVSALTHVQEQHQNTPRTYNGKSTNQNQEEKGKPKILKASQFQDSYIHIPLPNDEAAHFFTATAETMKDPRTNTIETRYIAPRFPESVLAIEEMVAYRNIATKEFQKWFKAYQQITTAKKLGSYRTYAGHNIGLENSYTALMIAGQKDKIFTLKNNAPTLYPTRIAELNEHLVTAFFHNQRIYCMESRIEWSSWFEICFSEKTIGREIFDRVQARLTGYPSVIETLKTISSFIEHIVLSLLPVQVPYAQRRTEILNIHIAQLNSSVPSVDFTRQHIDQHGQELRFLHPAANAATSLSTEQESRLQENIVDELLHEILAGTSFFGRLNQLYLPNPQYQDIRKVPKAKILEDLARLIAADRTAGTMSTVAARQTTTTSITKQPSRCTACAALNIACAPNHCKLHQPTWTPREVKNLQRSLLNPFKKKADCAECQEELIRKGMKELQPYNYKSGVRLQRDEEGARRAGTRSKSPRRTPSRSRSGNRRQARRSRSNSRNRANEKKQKNNPKSNPQVRTILSRNSGEPRKQESEPKKDLQHTQQQRSPPRPNERPQRPAREEEWNYARQRSPQGFSRNHSNSRPTRWQSRSPSPRRNRYGSQGPRPSSSRSPYNRRRSPYRSRSQSGYRTDSRDRNYRSRSISRHQETSQETTRLPPDNSKKD